MASSNFFHKPELALRRALELQGIRQEEAALALLHEVLSSRRHRTWSPAYEQIMMAYLDMCLDLHKSREAKDGLHQYRNLSQSQAPGSLEKVIRYLMEKAEQKCTEAKAFVDAASLANTEGDDEGFGASPQAILLSTMSTDPAKSQLDSNILLPSLKFLWETYRAVLDILRSNSKLEFVYHAAAQGALRFCCTYKRRMEFRHLCDMLRMHLGNLRQYGSIKEGDDSKSNNKVRQPERFLRKNHSYLDLTIVYCYYYCCTGPWLGRMDYRLGRVASADTVCTARDCECLASLHGRLPHG
jgi:translation initiation factor 3 subunit A